MVSCLFVRCCWSLLKLFCWLMVSVQFCFVWWGMVLIYCFLVGYLQIIVLQCQGLQGFNFQFLIFQRLSWDIVLDRQVLLLLVVGCLELLYLIIWISGYRKVGLLMYLVVCEGCGGFLIVVRQVVNFMGLNFYLLVIGLQVMILYGGLWGSYLLDMLMFLLVVCVQVFQQ